MKSEYISWFLYCSLLTLHKIEVGPNLQTLGRNTKKISKPGDMVKFIWDVLFAMRSGKEHPVEYILKIKAKERKLFKCPWRGTVQ
jgi:hypothetical protein